MIGLLSHLLCILRGKVCAIYRVWKTCLARRIRKCLGDRGGCRTGHPAVTTALAFGILGCQWRKRGLCPPPQKKREALSPCIPHWVIADCGVQEDSGRDCDHHPCVGASPPKMAWFPLIKTRELTRIYFHHLPICVHLPVSFRRHEQNNKKFKVNHVTDYSRILWRQDPNPSFEMTYFKTGVNINLSLSFLRIAFSSPPNTINNKNLTWKVESWISYLFQ